MIPFERNHGGSIVVKTTVIHDPRMSRDDPQFKLRMPAGLRDLADQAARAAGRSLNAELVARLEASFLSSASTEKLMSAARARELASMARAGVPDEIRRRILKGINRAVELGHSSLSVDLTDLQLDGGLSESEADEILSAVDKELLDAGYKVEWDGGASVWICF